MLYSLEVAKNTYHLKEQTYFILKRYHKLHFCYKATCTNINYENKNVNVNYRHFFNESLFMLKITNQFELNCNQQTTNPLLSILQPAS